MYISTAHTHGLHLLGPTLGIGATHGHPTLTQVGLGDHGVTTGGTVLGMILGTIPVITTDGTTPTITITIITITDTMIPIITIITTMHPTTATMDVVPPETTIMADPVAITMAIDALITTVTDMVAHTMQQARKTTVVA